ncbi:(deoxy)nucleoside triphosphate pyrophosphohydrolase [Novosphingobium sp. 9]|uniref:(deoxy)nucleoside triphosphate pyrophosphohydrolase n=1 Tax=Novosphingobium sp. 9 TaxID=2025349 RepID=UPI0028CB7309|nr:(deoxy)nucleoside triphosphate pyrophosphohydrolase [Novosphingobium sp. 9]
MAVALVRRDGHVLMQRRPYDSMHGGLWEFPGGKVEPGEAPAAAAVREMDEELAVTLETSQLEPVGFAGDVTAGVPVRTIVICLYIAHRWTGEPQPQVASEIEWVPAEALKNLEMPPLDYPLAEQLCTLMKKVENRC